MNLSNSIFEEFFMNKISEEELIDQLEVGSPQFEKKLKEEMKSTIFKRDGKRLAYLIYTLFLTENSIDMNVYLDILNQLIICDWHKEHENIAMILQKIHSPSSAAYLKKALYLNPEYLNWDDNYAFEVKIIWALGYIKNSESKKVLELASKESNEILARNARQQLSNW